MTQQNKREFSTEEIMKLVNKLIGSITPFGETYLDSERKENLEQYAEVFEMMLDQLTRVLYFNGRSEASIKDIVFVAEQALKEAEQTIKMSLYGEEVE